MTVTLSTKDEKRYAREIAKQRALFKYEMQRAIRCRTKKQKFDLFYDWKRTYSPMLVKELTMLARNETARLKVAEWDLGEFETKKLNKHQ
jgi:hypothetical protein